jgi:hypothetical protein
MHALIAEASQGRGADRVDNRWAETIGNEEHDIVGRGRYRSMCERNDERGDNDGGAKPKHHASQCVLSGNPLATRFAHLLMVGDGVWLMVAAWPMAR